ncbi:MAG: tetratricopeptide repeat protein [Leptospirales bacterium]|jgi:tetratricopeptide (TPR) repeat protein
MSDYSKKNRFHLEQGESPDDPRRAPGGRFRDARGDEVYIDDPDPRHTRRMRFRWFVLAGVVLLALLTAGGLWYYYSFYGSDGKGPGDAREFQRVGERLEDSYYIPSEDVSPELARAIALYRNYERDAAKRGFEQFITADAPDKEKSIAAIFLGVMALESERYSEAKRQFIRALKYNPESVGALVNMAVVERRLGNHADAQQYARQARELAPRDRNVALILGNILNESQDVEGAIDSYREGLSESPDDPLLLYNMALSLLRQEKYEEALLNFSKAARAARGGGTGLGATGIAVQAHAHMGQIYFRQGNLEMAADALRSAVQLAPDNGKFRYNLGVIYLRMNRGGQALQEFTRALDAGTNDADVYRALARAFNGSDLRQPALAIRALEKGLYLRPDDINTLFQLGELYHAENDLVNAARVYAKIVNITPGDVNTEDAYLKLAVVYSEMERYNDAIEVLERASGINPRNARTYFVLGQVYDRAGRRDLAIENWKKALRDASGPGDSDLADAGESPAPLLNRDEEREIRLAIAAAYRKEGAHDLALLEYNRVRERNRAAPAVASDPELDFEIGLTYMALKDYQNAVASFEAVAASGTADEATRKQAYLQIAAAYAESGDGRRLEEARANINKAVRMDPADQEARMLQAYILMKTNSMVDREKAVEILKAVTRSDIDAREASKAHNLLGLAYMQSGEYRRALASFEQAVRLDPGNSDAYRNQRAAANAYEKEL